MNKCIIFRAPRPKDFVEYIQGALDEHFGKTSTKCLEELEDNDLACFSALATLLLHEKFPPFEYHYSMLRMFESKLGKFLTENVFRDKPEKMKALKINIGELSGHGGMKRYKHEEFVHGAYFSYPERPVDQQWHMGEIQRELVLVDSLFPGCSKKSTENTQSVTLS